MALAEPKAESVSLEALLRLFEIAAARDADGHLTIMRFTTGWKVMLDTPDLRSGDGANEISGLEAFPTLAEALVDYFVT